MTTEQNTPDDIPTESGPVSVANTSLVVPSLPGNWHWRTTYRAELTNKVNVFFGHNTDSVGGRLGEIDNYQVSSGIKWDLHVRKIVSDGHNDGTVPKTEAETIATFDTLEDAISAVPAHISTHYE